MGKFRISRRDVLVGVAGAVGGGLVGCGDGLQISDEPVAHWQEDDDVFTDPLVLSGSVEVSPNAGDSAPSAQLANPLDIPIEVLACRFMITPMPTAQNEPVALQITGAQVGVKMDVADIPVVDAAVPISAFGTVRDTYENMDTVRMLVDGTGTANLQPALYGWRLKYPLMIPPQRSLACALTTLAQIPHSFRFDIAYICRTWDTTKPVPKILKVPWVASYKSKAFDYLHDAVVAQDQSKTLDLINPFKVPLEIARLTGRVTLAAVGSAPDTRTYTYEDLLPMRLQFSSMKMRSSRGFDLIRTAMPFDGPFPINWRAWDIPSSWLLAPGESYRARIDTTSITDDPDVRLSGREQFAIGMVGYRDVPSSALFGGAL